MSGSCTPWQPSDHVTASERSSSSPAGSTSNCSARCAVAAATASRRALGVGLRRRRLVVPRRRDLARGQRRARDLVQRDARLGQPHRAPGRVGVVAIGHVAVAQPEHKAIDQRRRAGDVGILHALAAVGPRHRLRAQHLVARPGPRRPGRSARSACRRLERRPAAGLGRAGGPAGASAKSAAHSARVSIRTVGGRTSRARGIASPFHRAGRRRRGNGSPRAPAASHTRRGWTGPAARR